MCDCVTLYCLPVPVSKPDVFQMCLSPEQMMVTCSSEGDVKEFNLSLDGYLLMQNRTCSQSPRRLTEDTPSLASNTTNQDTRSVSNVQISLYGQLTGNLMCNVRNNVSKEETVIQLTSCKGIVSQGMIKFLFFWLPLVDINSPQLILVFAFKYTSRILIWYVLQCIFLFFLFFIT